MSPCRPPKGSTRHALGSTEPPPTSRGRRIIPLPMTSDRVDSALDFGTGTSTDHSDGIRWVDYANISWNPVFCKRCDICIEICPKDTLVMRNDAVIEEQNCILCGLCERY